jgi:hypothetical protein
VSSKYDMVQGRDIQVGDELAEGRVVRSVSDRMQPLPGLSMRFANYTEADEIPLHDAGNYFRVAQMHTGIAESRNEV